MGVVKDKAHNPIVFGLTGQLVAVFEQVLGQPEEQLTQETRGKLMELVVFIGQKDRSVIAPYAGLMSIAQRAG